jgi:3-deoxy-D-manno-octulosonic-acid transferase
LRYFYTILFYLALPFILLRLFWRGRRIPGNHQRWLERFGFCRFKLERCLWVHAVSVGETIAAIPLIKALQHQYPHLPIVVTNMTVTGAARVKAAFGDNVLQTFIPYDLPGAVARFLQCIKPQVAVIMETELWPNLFAACQNRNIPIVVLNARLSEKSANGYQKMAPLTRAMLAAVHSLGSQGYADAERFIALGLAKEKVTVTGNLKFDLDIPADLATKAIALRQQLGATRLIWIAASTHPSEEEIMLAAQRLIQVNYPSALLILVPRHPDRFDAVAGLCEQQGFKLARRSRGDRCAEQTEIYLGDTMGELLLLYSVADVALVAGSFVQVGGHNMLEPAALAKPILTGPILFNFAEITDMLFKANGMFKVRNAEELAQQVQKLFADPMYRATMGANAYQVVAANRGALARQIKLVVNAVQR